MRQIIYDAEKNVAGWYRIAMIMVGFRCQHNKMRSINSETFNHFTNFFKSTSRQRLFSVVVPVQELFSISPRIRLMAAISSFEARSISSRICMACSLSLWLLPIRSTVTERSEKYA